MNSRATIISPEVSKRVSREDTRSSEFISVSDTIPIYVKELIAGGAAGGISKTIVAPLERVKILYQVNIPFLVVSTIQVEHTLFSYIAYSVVQKLYILSEY
jgi:hypothetical protein